VALKIYKRGQGKYTRTFTAIAAVVIVGLGCLQLYRKLEAADLTLWVERMVPAGLFVALSLLVSWMVNKPSVADFMIAAEGEMKKVSWSSRAEIVVSTIVVIVVVVFMAVLLGVSDIGFELFFDRLLR
jgi:preprotein translocase subunit SecE